MRADTVFIGSEIYRTSRYGRRHPLAIPRVSTVMELCRALGWLDDSCYIESPLATVEQLCRFHDPAYVAAVIQAEQTQKATPELIARHNIGKLENPIYGEIFRRPATAVGASLLAADLIAGDKARRVHTPAGGTHHGRADRASGFCYFNDPVLAIKVLLRQGLSRIAYVDIDAHHCDGVAAAFAGEPRVLMISTHEADRWPFTGKFEDDAGGNAINLPLPRGTGDDGFALVRDDVILPAVQAMRPEAIVLQCGADAVAEDPLARLELSNNAHWALLAALMPMAPRLLVLGGGGYNPWTVGRLWAGVWATLNRYEIPDRLPEDAEAVLAGLTWSRRSRGPMPTHLCTTLRDAPRPGPVSEALRRQVAELAARRRVWA